MTGRGFDDRDTRESVPVCMVNGAFVRGYLQGRSPIGLRVAVRGTSSEAPVEREIVGVARQVKGRPEDESLPENEAHRGSPLAPSAIRRPISFVRCSPERFIRCRRRDVRGVRRRERLEAHAVAFECHGNRCNHA